MKRFSLFVLLVVLACQSIVSSQDRVLKLDGEGDYVDLGQPDFMPQAYTLETKIFRVKSTTAIPSTLSGLITKDGRPDGSGPWSIHWSIGADKQRFHHHYQDSPALYDKVIIPFREWVHLAVVFTGSQITFYTNGVGGESFEYSPTTVNTVPWWIGTGSGHRARRCDGGCPYLQRRRPDGRSYGRQYAGGQLGFIPAELFHGVLARGA